MDNSAPDYRIVVQGHLLTLENSTSGVGIFASQQDDVFSLWRLVDATDEPQKQNRTPIIFGGSRLILKRERIIVCYSAFFQSSIGWAVTDL